MVTFFTVEAETRWDIDNALKPIIDALVDAEGVDDKAHIVRYVRGTWYCTANADDEAETHNVSPGIYVSVELRWNVPLTDEQMRSIAPAANPPAESDIPF
jgi:hypothetical protein